MQQPGQQKVQEAPAEALTLMHQGAALSCLECLELDQCHLMQQWNLAHPDQK